MLHVLCLDFEKCHNQNFRTLKSKLSVVGKCKGEVLNENTIIIRHTIGLFNLKPTCLLRLHLVCNDPHDVDSTQSKVDRSQHPLLLHAHVTQEIQDGVKQVVPTFRNVVNAFTNHHLKNTQKFERRSRPVKGWRGGQ